MNVRLPIAILLGGTILCAATFSIWSPLASVRPHPTQREQRAGTLSNQVAPSNSLSVEERPPSAPAPNLRVQFRQSRNYAEFVRSISEAAAAGDPIAEYLTAKALKYCHDSAHWRIRAPGGSPRTRNELEIRTGSYPLSLQQDILDAYDRCQGFLQDGARGDSTGAWESWLEKAVAAGYAPAQSLKADMGRVAEMMRDTTSAASGDVLPPPAGPIRDLAITAALSGDPESILEMMNWVDGSKRPGEEYWVLTSAWGLLACQRGFDGCGPTSSWFRSVCSWDAQCADDASVVDTLRRQLGSRFEDAQNLASEIGQAIDNQDESAIESHL